MNNLEGLSNPTIWMSWTADLDGPFELPSFSPSDLTTMALAVNDAGQIVGEVQVVSPTPVFHAALWDNDEVIDLGVLPEAGEGTSMFGGPALVTTTATGINDAGVIIGNSIPSAETPEVRHGPFVHRDGVMTNLNDLLHESSAGWAIRGVQAINDDGVIAGDGHFAGGVRRAVLLVPVETGVTGDLDGDGDVGTADLLLLLASWGACAACTADLDGDNVVGTADLLILLAAWTTL